MTEQATTPEQGPPTMTDLGYAIGACWNKIGAAVRNGQAPTDLAALMHLLNLLDEVGKRATAKGVG